MSAEKTNYPFLGAQKVKKFLALAFYVKPVRAENDLFIGVSFHKLYNGGEGALTASTVSGNTAGHKSEKTKLGGLCAQHHLKNPGDWGWSWWQHKDNIS